MSYLLDTCVLSEFTHREPNSKVISWLDLMDESLLFLSVITLGEIQSGVMRLGESKRKNELMVWMNLGVTERFKQRVLPITNQTMLTWGTLTARLERNGNPIPVMDSLIAATVIEHNLILVTRNTGDFLQCGFQMINPWEWD